MFATFVDLVGQPLDLWAGFTGILVGILIFQLPFAVSGVLGYLERKTAFGPWSELQAKRSSIWQVLVLAGSGACYILALYGVVVLVPLEVLERLDALVGADRRALARIFLQAHMVGIALGLALVRWQNRA